MIFAQIQENNMKKNKKKAKNKVINKKNLSIINQGDTVVIRNRSSIAASVVSVIILGVCAAGIFTLRAAWELPLFWLMFCIFIAGTLFSLAKSIFGKVVLDSPKTTMTVYNPFPISYKFEDVNYVDLKTEKGGDGQEVHVVTAYIGIGKRSVQLVSYSKEQAQELAILLRGMLDNGAMIYPEGDEEPFNFDEDKRFEFNFIKRNKKIDKAENKDSAADTGDKSDNADTDKEKKENE